MIGIALSGGGARGIAHLGVLKALLEKEIKPDVLSGTSAGSIVAALYAAGYTPEEGLEIIKKTNILSVFKPSYSWKGLLSIDKLGAILKKYLPANFEELNQPVYIAATDIYAGTINYFNTGKLVPAVLASCCIPVVFKPVLIANTSYVDGGILNNLPAEAIRDKVDTLIGVSCNPRGEVKDLHNARLLMERSSLLAINGNTEVSKKLCDYTIEPPDLVRFSGLNLSQASDIFDTGYHYTHNNMDKFVLTSKK
jgi:NTE family protein